MDDQLKVACVLSNGAIINHLERPLTWFSRSRHSPFIDTEYLTNGYYGRRIENRTQAFKWYYFQ